MKKSIICLVISLIIKGYCLSYEWVVENLEHPGNTALYNAIAVDSNNKVHIIFNDGSGIKYQTNASGSWVLTTLESSGSSPSSIAIDKNNKVHVCYIVPIPVNTIFLSMRQMLLEVG